MLPKTTIKRVMKNYTDLNISSEAVDELINLLEEMIKVTTEVAEKNAKREGRKTILRRDIKNCDEERLKRKILELSERTDKMPIIVKEILAIITSELE
ncbi:Transcription factor CBF/NF-Y/histone domain protein [Methanocaldococcus infernus ME]|uniref:Transcription factor CBF/NF-Y/histone domain protein n=1 Tax=Methanocaldococcus infernus (strain DSM 11812 / JCM 15783 / ME) TaxID=573063 RepID=D5VTW4_METIM|nr:histone [Methanocaldococcus infernus]ADG14017.1 Transcription factor CBF/NF-Y/histone domain protein [Methanocaldococcus infernus ME]